MHPIAPRPTALAALLLIAHQSALLRLVSSRLARPAARGTLGRIQLLFLGSITCWWRTNSVIGCKR